jgi:uncharacterized protein YkwD
MVRRDFRGHVSPEGLGLKERLAKANLTGFLFAGENIASGFGTVGEALASLMRSEGHRRNILSRLFTHVGCGAWPDSDGALVIVQVFLRPRPWWLGGQ